MNYVLCSHVSLIENFLAIFFFRAESFSRDLMTRFKSNVSVSQKMKLRPRINVHFINYSSSIYIYLKKYLST